MFAPTPFQAPPRPAFGRAAQHLAEPAPKTTKADRRYMLAARTAAALLPDLPEPGETVHALMTGLYDLCQVITATAKRLPELRHVRIATLCFSRRNTAELLSLLDTTAGLRLTLLVSNFFKAHSKELYESFTDDLRQHPTARIAAARSHCKVVCFDFGHEDGLVFEGSANLRTNGNREQLNATRDRELHDWHAGWIDELVGTAAAE